MEFDEFSTPPASPCESDCSVNTFTYSIRIRWLLNTINMIQETTKTVMHEIDHLIKQPVETMMKEISFEHLSREDMKMKEKELQEWTILLTNRLRIMRETKEQLSADLEMFFNQLWNKCSPKQHRSCKGDTKDNETNFESSSENLNAKGKENSEHGLRSNLSRDWRLDNTEIHETKQNYCHTYLDDNLNTLSEIQNTYLSDISNSECRDKRANERNKEHNESTNKEVAFENYNQRHMSNISKCRQSEFALPEVNGKPVLRSEWRINLLNNSKNTQRKVAKYCIGSMSKCISSIAFIRFYLRERGINILLLRYIGISSNSVMPFHLTVDVEDKAKLNTIFNGMRIQEVQESE
ncbi:uncharacterized protein LOC127709922 [Mytilus californianus]|uniref:uncharacterized protein LOC127709922 n=1 Tax=Mytilus californianus TaxID=6549 RepID=UPI00224745A7|nr:uncharacterized protein LOC127709922 [Mytilus californianus]